MLTPTGEMLALQDGDPDRLACLSRHALQGQGTAGATRAASDNHYPPPIAERAEIAHSILPSSSLTIAVPSLARLRGLNASQNSLR